MNLRYTKKISTIKKIRKIKKILSSVVNSYLVIINIELQMIVRIRRIMFVKVQL